MSYQVLARKWRPRAFPEMVGQEHVLRALVNALDQGRLHHAYLFSGTRGVGKTTLARILAKSLNCEAGVSSRPCGTCPACREIDEGRFVDLIEVDAASRTKVEDTRELLENVQYTPTRGRYKVYLIDEVHMLSMHSFNALLKTLEEPPPHVKFLLATTDPQRLPVTILSRCLQFNLKRLPVDRIRAHLAYILMQEGISFEPRALAPIARAADGSMRDALSLLDQAIGYGGGQVREAEVQTMLGAITRDEGLALLEAIAANDARDLLAAINGMAEQVPDFGEALAELMSLLQRLALAQFVPTVLEEDEERERLSPLASRLSPEEVQLLYQIALIGRRDLPLAPEPRGGFEMVLLRMLAFRPVQVDAIVAEATIPEWQTVPQVMPSQETGSTDSEERPSRTPSLDQDWAMTVMALPSGLARQLASHCILERREGDMLYLIGDSAHATLLNEKSEEKLCQALERHFGAPVKVRITIGRLTGETPAQQQSRAQTERQRAAVEAIEQDPYVREMQETFGATIKPSSIRPLER
jgi:DNA polymerase-3 subunit gamma/tau